MAKDSKSSQTYNYDYSQTDNRVAQTGESNLNLGGGTIGGNVTFTSSDPALAAHALGVMGGVSGGAFETAVALGQGSNDVLSQVIDLFGNMSNQLMTDTAKSQQQALGFVNQYTDRAQTGGATAAMSTVKWLALGVGVVAIVIVGMVMFKK